MAPRLGLETRTCRFLFPPSFGLKRGPLESSRNYEEEEMLLGLDSNQEPID